MSDPAWERCAVFDHLKRCGNRPTALVAQDEDQRNAKFCHGVLDTTLRRKVNRVAGITDDEQLTKTSTKQDLWRNARVGAANQNGDWSLRLGYLKPARPIMLGCR